MNLNSRKGSFTINNTTYSIHQKSISSSFSLKNKSNGSRICMINFTGDCCKQEVHIEFANNIKALTGRFMLNGQDAW